MPVTPDRVAGLVWAAWLVSGQFVDVPPGAFISVPVAIDPAEAAITPARGLVIVTQDNKNGPKEADLIPVAAIQP